MSGLFENLSSVSAALQAHSKSVELSGRNIANINNPGYARQRVNTSSVSMLASGEVTTFVDREVQNLSDDFVDQQVVEEAPFCPPLKPVIIACGKSSLRSGKRSIG